jgi:hypothetical protein
VRSSSTDARADFVPVAARKDSQPDSEAPKSAFGRKAVTNVDMTDADAQLPMVWDFTPALLDIAQMASKPTSPVARFDPTLPFPDVVNSPPAYLCRDLTEITEHALKIDFVSLFERGEDGNGKLMLDRRALLLYHPVSHAEDMEAITRWLLMHHVEVYSPWYDGCWDQYTQHLNAGGSGIVIVSGLSGLDNYVYLISLGASRL